MVLGIDPGTTTLGYGVVSGGAGRAATLLECGIVRPGTHEPLSVRLNVIFDGVCALVEQHQQDVVAVESVFHGKYARSALVLGHARGVVLLAVQRANRVLAEITPAEVKRAVTGTGRASKEQVAAMVARLLHLAAPPQPSDAADGVAIALTHLLRMDPKTRLVSRSR